MAVEGRLELYPHNRGALDAAYENVGRPPAARTAPPAPAREASRSPAR